MDLNNFDSTTSSEAGLWLTLKNPRTGAPTDARIKVAGPDSKTYRQAQRAVTRAQRLRVAMDGDNLPSLTTEEQLDLIAPCVLAWERIERDGQPLACTPENVRAVLAQYPIILRQIDFFIGDVTNFLLEISANLAAGQSGASA